MTFTCSLCSAQATEKFFLLIALRAASPETLPEGSFLGQPVIAVREHREVGEAPPRPPRPQPPHPRLRFLTFHIPHLASLGGVGGLIAQQEERNKCSWGACCVPSTVPTPRPPPSHSVPTTSLGGRWSHAVHWPGEEAGSERVSHLPGVTQLEPGFQPNSS